MKAPNYEHYLDLETGKAIDAKIREKEAAEAIEHLSELAPMIAGVAALVIIGTVLRAVFTTES